METITVKSTATNSELLKLVQSLTIDTVDFDNLHYTEARNVMYAIDRGFSELIHSVGEVKKRIEANCKDINRYKDIDRMLEMGLYDITLNLNFAGSRLEFGQYQIKIIK